MGRLLKLCIRIGLLTICFLSTNTFSANQSENDQLRAEIRRITLREELLEKQVMELTAELHRRNKSPRVNKHKSHRNTEHTILAKKKEPTPKKLKLAAEENSQLHIRKNVARKTMPPGTTSGTQPRLVNYVQNDGSLWPNLPVTVVTSPILGFRSVYNASDLLRLYPTVNEDLVLLQERQKIVNQFAEQGYSLTRPIVEISGGVEGSMFDAHGYRVTFRDHDINLSSAEIDINGIMSSWSNAFLALAYDNSPASSGSRDPNGRIFLKRGFVNIGDLNVAPFWGSLGETYAPFGRYASAMLTTPLTQSLARIRTGVATLGYTNGGFHTAIYGYSGDRINGGQSMIKQEGAYIRYQKELGGVSFDFGAGGVTNIADSEGMQGNGLPLRFKHPEDTEEDEDRPINFAGFGVNPRGNFLEHQVGGMDFNGEISFGSFSLLAEFAGATRNFDRHDLTFNTDCPRHPDDDDHDHDHDPDFHHHHHHHFHCEIHGAQPQAFHSELAYSTELFTKPFGVGFSYGHTWEALALNLPENSFAVFSNISIWKDTVQSIEYRHDNDYSRTTRAGGAGVPNGNFGTGRDRNTLTLQVGAYF